MGRLKKAGNIILAVTMAGFIAGMATGCSDKVSTRAEELNNKLTTAVVQVDDSISDFSFTGAEVDKAGFDFDVSFNGVASLKDESNAFASIHYKVPHTVFGGLEKSSSVDAVYDVFDYIVDNYSPEELNITKVGDIEKFNTAIIKNTPSSFDGYRLKRGFVYDLSSPTFNDETKSVSFGVKTIMDVEKGAYQPGFGLGMGFSGGIGLGLSFGIFSEGKGGTFVVVDNYTVSLSEEDYEYLKSDPNFVYEVCADAIERKDAGILSVERESTNTVTYDNADLLNKIDFNSAVQELDR